ncbi:MAG: hydrogenase maturation nickel metallochaperone HypA [Cyanobacteriota bacterium]|nr:hydrogenase maturation nickel metallochaperone HypA [Cyanobacteriota bacterium]
MSIERGAAAVHELSLMQTLGERVLAVATEHAADRVVAIRLRIGSLAGVDPEALRFAAEVVLAGTCAEGATLAIEESAAAWWCEPCGADFDTLGNQGACPRCGTPSARLARGKELALVALELLP